MPDILTKVRSDRWLLAAVTLAILVRVGLFFASMLWPIPNERGELVSPLLPQGYYDFQFYLESLHRYVSAPATLASEFLEFYRHPLSSTLPQVISGPVFPLLMWITGFDDGYFLPLALAYAVLCCALAIFWLLWLRGCGLRGFWLVGFAVIPNPMWFMLVVSTDLLFAFEFAVFFLAYFQRPTSRALTLTWSTALLLMVLTRPNSVSVLLFVALDAVWSFFRERRVARGRAVMIAALLLVAGLYLFPYFVAEMNKAGNSLDYFGATPAQYLRGIFPDLPHWLNLGLSWPALLGAKLLYFTGIRPSYGSTHDVLVALRAAPGIILLPGLVLVMLKAPWRLRALVALYCLPFLLGPAQDRYHITIFPILYLYGAEFWTAALHWLRRRRRVEGRSLP